MHSEGTQLQIRIFALNFLRTFHDIVSDQQLQFGEKAQRLLQFGLDIFKLDIGIISRISGDEYTIAHVISPNNELQPGMSFDINNTYCVDTLNTNSVIAYHHVGESNVSAHPCYQTMQLESYIGVPIKVGEKSIGTLNFSSATPAPTFTTEQKDYIELFAQWLGSEIARNNTVKTLKRNNRKYTKLERVGNIGSWEVDIDKNRLTWSDQTRVIHEVDDDFEPHVETAIEFYREGASRESITKAVEHGMQTGEPWFLELQLVTAKGNEIWVSTHGEAEFKDGRCIRLFGTFQDVTEAVEMRKALEKQKQEAEALLDQRSKLLAKISHELRTPLNGITGMLSTLMDEQNTDKRNEKIALARRSSDTLLRLINEVLDYSKINYGELKLEPSHFLLKTVFTDLVSMYHPVCKDRQTNLEHALNIADDCWVYFDSTRLSQIVSNLLSNAAKFTENGGVKLKVSAKAQTDKVNLLISVSDTGIGMTDETLGALFKPFSQGAPNITLKYGGTGLGLSIVKELIDRMDGQIHVKSQFGQGTTFTVALSVPIGSEVQDSIDDPADLDLDTTGLRVLVVDDNEINRLVMESYLHKFNVDAKYAMDGQDAIYKCQEYDFDLIFMDCIMPEVDGFEATKRLRQDNIISTKTIVAALTANTSDADKAACKAAGMNLFLSKPVKTNMVKQALKAAIDNK